MQSLLNYEIFLEFFAVYFNACVFRATGYIAALSNLCVFSNEAKAEWTAFENNWNYFSYAELKKQQRIKNLNCSNCESFFADLYLEIGPEGKINTIKFMKGKRCGLPINDTLLKDQFESTLKKQSFRHLKNKAFIARFGHVLKC